MATTSFTAGAFTLTGWNTAFSSAGATPGTGNQMLTDATGAAAFDFSTVVSIDANDSADQGPNQANIASPATTDTAQLVVSFIHLYGSVNLESNLSAGGHQASDGAFTLGGATGESASALINDLRSLGVIDDNDGETFALKFTLTDFTGVTPGATTTFTEAFFTTCYAPGTRVATPTGEVAVEDLQIGDLIATTSGAAKPVMWIGRRSHSAADVAKHVNLRPVMVRKDALGGGLPHRDLVISPMHALLIDEVFVPAAALVNGTSIVRSEAAGPVEYIHVELDQHDVIFAEGAAAETFVNDDSRALFDNVSEYYDLYGIAESRGAFAAPRLEEGYELEAIRQRIAGVAPLAAAPGALSGHVERLEDGVLEGWVMDAANPTTPVELEVLVDGEIVATVLANRYRADLDHAGYAGGRGGFTVAMPASAESLAQVEVRRASDGGQVAAPKRALVTA